MSEAFAMLEIVHLAKANGYPMVSFQTYPLSVKKILVYRYQKGIPKVKSLNSPAQSPSAQPSPQHPAQLPTVNSSNTITFWDLIKINYLSCINSCRCKDFTVFKMVTNYPGEHHELWRLSQAWWQTDMCRSWSWNCCQKQRLDANWVAIAVVWYCNTLLSNHILMLEAFAMLEIVHLAKVKEYPMVSF